MVVADELDVVESVEKRSDNTEQMMAESSDCTGTGVKQSTLPLLPKPVLLTPQRRASAADSTLHVTVPVSSEADSHSDGNQRQIISRRHHCQSGLPLLHRCRVHGVL